MEIHPIVSGVEHRPLVIAGPCSAESAGQVMECARGLAGGGVDIFRAGLWKPRTHPGGFEGVGARGLPWLREVNRLTGLPVATEIGSAAHFEAALRHGIEIFWIGARTSANPFAVQEIADAIRESGRDVAVMVKNPVSPDLELWIGAIQRIYNAGVRRLAAIHRGFSSYGSHTYRNPPQWSIPIALRRRIPKLPVICDPSHISGRRDMIQRLSQQALDSGFAGLMIETHPCPECALSDADQQVTPTRLKEILSSLRLRSEGTADAELESLRDKIDACDAELLDVLRRRMEVSAEIGEYKRRHNLPAVQMDRHKDIMTGRIEEGAAAGLPAPFVRHVMEAIHEESVRRQLEIINPDKR